MNSEARSILIKVVGEDWLTEQVNKANEQLDKFTDQFSSHSLGFRFSQHPLVSFRNRLDTQLILSNMSDSDTIIADGEISRMQTIEADINTLWDVLDIEQLGIRLRHSDEFDKVEYELHVAAAYKRNGLESRLVPTNTNRTPDVAIRIPDSDKELFIEVKHKDISPQDIKENRFVKELTSQVHNFLDQLNLSMGLSIEFTKSVDDVEIHEIINKLKESIKWSCTEIKTSDYSANMEIFGDSKSKIKKERINRYYDFDYDMGSVKYDLSQSNIKEGYVVNPRLITVNFNLEVDIDNMMTSIKNSVRKATRQIEKESPGLIYIDIGKRSRKNSALVLKASKTMLHDILRNNKRISGVVLTSLFWKDVQLGALYIVGNEYIGNPWARLPTPENIVVVGSDEYTFIDDIKKIL